MSHTFTTLALYTLAAVVLASLSMSLMAVFGIIDYISIIDKNNLSLLPGISISSGGMIAILAFFRDRQNQKKDRVRKSDEIYLSIARQSFDEVFDLLKDRNNNRLIWVRASRLLLQALALKTKIETPDIIEAFQLAEEGLRTELYRTLRYTTKKHKNKQPLPPQFFYGIEDWETEKSLDEAAIKGGSKMVVSSVNIHENVPEASSGGLSIKTVITIYDFLKFPDDYNDPILNVQNWDDNWEDSHGISQGAKRFVSHANNNFVINGKIHKKS